MATCITSHMHHMHHTCITQHLLTFTLSKHLEITIVYKYKYLMQVKAFVMLILVDFLFVAQSKSIRLIIKPERKTSSLVEKDTLFFLILSVNTHSYNTTTV